MSKHLAENDLQNWCMTMFQTQIVSQRKINDWYHFLPSHLIENEKCTLPDDHLSFLSLSVSDIQGSFLSSFRSCC